MGGAFPTEAANISSYIYSTQCRGWNGKHLIFPYVEHITAVETNMENECPDRLWTSETLLITAILFPRRIPFQWILKWARKRVCEAGCDNRCLPAPIQEYYVNLCLLIAQIIQNSKVITQSEKSLFLDQTWAEYPFHLIIQSRFFRIFLGSLTVSSLGLAG